MTAGTLGLRNIDNWKSGIAGGYVFLTNAGARLGYRTWLTEDGIVHNRVVVTKNQIELVADDQYNSKSCALVITPTAVSVMQYQNGAVVSSKTLFP